MSQTLDPTIKTPCDQTPRVPSKSDIIAALQQDNSRAGLSLEWLLDRCDTRNGQP